MAFAGSYIGFKVILSFDPNLAGRIILFEYFLVSKKQIIIIIVDYKKYIDKLNNHSWSHGINNKEKSFELALEARDLSLKNEYLVGLANSYLNLGWYFLGKSKYVIALGVFKKSKELFNKLNDIESLTKSITGISATNYYAGNYAYCIDANIENILFCEKIGNMERLITALTNSAAVFVKLKKGDKALEFSKRSMDIYSELEVNYEQEAIIFKNLGDSYLILNNLDKAEYYIIKSYEAASKLGFNECKYECLTTLGKIYHQKGEVEKAEKFFNDVYVLCQNKLNSEELIFEIANFYYSIGDYIKARIFLEETINSSIKNNLDNTLLSACKLMTSIEGATGESFDSSFVDLPEFFERADINKENEKTYLREEFGITCNKK